MGLTQGLNGLCCSRPNETIGYWPVLLETKRDYWILLVTASDQQRLLETSIDCNRSAGTARNQRCLVDLQETNREYWILLVTQATNIV